jgi:hypothetical protein
MSAPALPVDRATIDSLRKQVPDLSEIELPSLPSMQDVSKSADEAVQRLLGRRRRPIWPWIAIGLGLVALVGVVAAYVAWFRRPAWGDDGGATKTFAIDDDMTEPGEGPSEDRSPVNVAPDGEMASGSETGPDAAA